MPISQTTLSACEAFSTGQLEHARPCLAETVRMAVAGGETHDGLDAVTAYCQSMTQGGCPELVITRTHIAETHVIVEGRSVGSDTDERGFHFCDVHSIHEGKIMAITCYPVCESES